MRGNAALEIEASDGDVHLGVAINLSGGDGDLINQGTAIAGGFVGGDFSSRGIGPGGGFGGGGGYGGSGGGSTPTSGQPYGEGTIEDLLGGSGGGGLTGTTGGGGGGAIKLVASKKLLVDAPIIANGGQGVSGSGGGSGGAIYLKGNSFSMTANGSVSVTGGTGGGAGRTDLSRGSRILRESWKRKCSSGWRDRSSSGFFR